MQQYFAKSPALISILTKENGLYISVNNAFTKVTGYSVGEIIGKTKEELDLLHQENTADIQTKYLSNEPIKELIIAYKSKSNACKHIIVSSEEIIINGKHCLMEVGIDATDTVKYRREIEKLEQFNLIGQMSSAIAHELRNPLQVVKGFLQLLKGKQELGMYATYLNMMIDEIERANRVITEYLSLSKLKPRNLKLMDINAVINSVLPLIEAMALEENKNVQAFLDHVPPVLLNEDEIKQLILNITKNGLDAMQEHQVVKISTYVKDDLVVLGISDQGCGIPPESRDKIELPFYSTKENGTGIGLPISYSIAKRHHASIEFTSNKDGTDFFVYFPIPKTADGE